MDKSREYLQKGDLDKLTTASALQGGPRDRDQLLRQRAQGQGPFAADLHEVNAFKGLIN